MTAADTRTCPGALGPNVTGDRAVVEIASRTLEVRRTLASTPTSLPTSRETAARDRARIGA
jgi:hypothetical protein